MEPGYIRKLLHEAIRDEQKAQKFYKNELIKSLIAFSDYNNAELIAEIKRDEDDHEKILKKMLKDYRG